MNFSPMRATEKEIFTIDFAPLLAQGETINSPIWTITVVAGQDPEVAAMISGNASISGTTVSQLIKGGVPGNRYAPVCTVQTSLGQTLVLPEVGQGELYIAQ